MNENVLKYKGYYATVIFSAEDSVLFGKLEMINDLVTFEADSADEVEGAFHEAVDNYLAMCEELGKAPDKTYSGSFNVRISPELHKALAAAALKEGCTLNQIVVEAIEKYINGDTQSVVYNQTINVSENTAQALGYMPTITSKSNFDYPDYYKVAGGIVC